MGMVASIPFRAASALRRRASFRGWPSWRLAFSVSSPGPRASSMVFSPRRALPRSTMPRIPASSIWSQSSAVSSILVPAAVPARRKKVPYRGPLAPPTLETRVMPTVRRMVPMSRSATPFRRSRTAWRPRCMLAPWSASPRAASSAVRYSLCCSTAAAKARIHARTASLLITTVSASHPSHAPPEARGRDGTIPEADHLIVQPQEGEGDALHLQRGDVGADQTPDHLEPVLIGQGLRLPVGDVELDLRGAAHPVDEEEAAVAGLEGEVLHHALEEHGDHLIGGLQLHPLPAGFAVDADADLHLVLGQLEGGLAAVGVGAGGQGHPHAPAVGVDPLQEGLELLQVVPFFSRGPDDLLGQHRQAHPAPALGVEAVLHGHVVIDDDAGRPDPFGFQE